MMLINNYRAILMSLSQAHAKSNREEILNTLVILFFSFTSTNF